MNTQKKGKVRGRQAAEEEAKQEEKVDLKLPFDMKSFWKNINEKYFRRCDRSSANEVNHLVQSFSKYGKLTFNLLRLPKRSGLHQDRLPQNTELSRRQVRRATLK